MKNNNTDLVLEMKRRLLTLTFLMNRFDGGEMANLDLSVSQAKIICLLFNNDKNEIIQKDIDYALGVTHATSSGIVKRMVEKGLVYVEQSQKDKRKKIILPTEKSRELNNEINRLVFASFDKLTNNISDDELNVFNDILAKMLHNMK